MLVTANHILHYHGAVDGFGHVSARNPDRPDTYFICGYMPPAVVRNIDDFIEYHVEDSTPVDSNAKKGYSERYIHGELFRRYPDIQCVVHSHAEAVLPYVTSSVPLVPVYHMGGFLQGKVPVWDISLLYEGDYQQDMLVNNAKFGASLADSFSSSPTGETSSSQTSGPKSTPDHNVVLMRRHGYTTHGKDIPTAVYRTLYTLINAGVQTNAMNISSAAYALDQAGGVASLELNDRQAKDCQKMNEATQDKSWVLWCHEVNVNPMYKNEI